MNENENLVTENVAENVEQTTEQTPQVKTYTQEEVDAIVSRRNARTRAKIEKEYERKYGNLVDTLKAGTGKESVDEINDTFKEFYTKQGITIPEKPKYSDRDVETLAKADAEEIIRSGFEEVVEEVDRLAEIGAANMTAREKALFRVLAEHRKTTEMSNELAKIGVGEDVYNSAEFQEFKGMFDPKTPIAKIYETYAKTQPTKNIKPMGSMKHDHQQTKKDYYSPEEIDKLTESDLDDPEVWATVRRSMTGR
jgi:hypothetical protein